MMATKMGQKKDSTEPKKRINPVSKKRQKEMPEYNRLVNKLTALCNNKSELSGELGVESHHIIRGTSRHLLNVFEIIMLTPAEHILADSYGYDKKQELLDFIKPIRVSQGFTEGA